jgi:hypothetical protein
VGWFFNIFAWSQNNMKGPLLREGSSNKNNISISDAFYTKYKSYAM